jgi:hypothetical protein
MGYSPQHIDDSLNIIQKKPRWSLLPVRDILRRKLLRRDPISLESVADRDWEIAPSVTSITPRAYYLPNQLERVTGWTGTHVPPKLQMEGGRTVVHMPTRGFLLRNAWLIDGVLYSKNGCAYLHPRSRRWPPQVQVDNEIERGAIFCSETGNRYFAHWLMDDCLKYPLAIDEGIPITTDHPVGRHVPAYEDWLEMRPQRLHDAFLKEVVIFSDRGQNHHRHARFRAMSNKLLSRVDAKPHPGVFILRGSDGEQRLLHNELSLAEYLREKRGFRILDIGKADVPTIVATCAGARVVVGVEGSHLIHGILVLPPGGAILTLQPPNRFVDSYKLMADRDHQHFGFVVGMAAGAGFRVDPDEVERTLDLFPGSRNP